MLYLVSFRYIYIINNRKYKQNTLYILYIILYEKCVRNLK